MSKGDYRHYMEKEIYEQPEAIMNTINGRVGGDDVLDNVFGLGLGQKHYQAHHHHQLFH